MSRCALIELRFMRIRLRREVGQKYSLSVARLEGHDFEAMSTPDLRENHVIATTSPIFESSVLLQRL